MKNAGIYVLTVCAVALAMLGSSCKKETKPFEVGEIIEIGASIDNDDNGAKTFIHENGNSTDVYWSDDDKLTLFRMNGNESSEFSIVRGDGTPSAKFRGECPGNGPFLAFYPNNNVTYASATKTFTYTLPSTIEYDAMSNHNGPMVGYLQAEIEEGTELKFHNVLPCIYLKLKGTAKVKKVSIWDKQDQVISGTLTFKVDGSGSITTSTINVAANSSNPNASKYVSVVSQNAIQLSETEPTIFSFSVPKGIGTRRISVFVYDENDEVVGSYSSDKINTQYGKAYRIEIDEINSKQALPENSGHFSVGPETSNQVDFAPGNLFYNNLDGEFHIETTQCLLPLKDSYDASHVNRFYFATKDNLADSYKEFWAGYKDPSADDVFFTNETATTSNPELQIDGQTNTGYRVLSDGEWEYLLNGRNNATALRAVKRIAVPDPAGFDSFIVGLVVLTDNSDPAWLPNIHSLADVDKVGALFISPQGYYHGEWGYFDGVGRYLQYWGSNCLGDKSAYLLQAFWNYDNTNSVKVAELEYFYAQSVRLAKDVTAK